MDASRRTDAAMLVGASVVLVPIAWWSYGLGTIELRYSLAGWAPVYGLVPEWTIGAGVFVSLILAGVMLVMHRRRRPTRQGRIRWRWWFILVAAWAAYFSGAAIVVSGGGSVAQSGTLRVELGEPIGWTAHADATCRSVVGEAGTVAEIRSSGVNILLRSLPLGGPAYADPHLSLTMLLSNAELFPESVRERPAITREWLDASGRATAKEDLSFDEVYSTTAIQHSASQTGSSGTVKLHASMGTFVDSSFARFTNAVVADDPLPQEFDMTVSWSCDSSAS